LSSLTIVHVLTRLLKAGSEENTLHSCESQAAAGHRVVLLHGAEFDPDVAERARKVADVICAPSLVHPISPSHDLRALADLTRTFRDLRADVVHTHQSKAGILGRLAARTAGTPLIVHGVHILPWVSVGRSQKTVYLAAERLCARFTDAFISVSPSVRDECLRERIGGPEAHHVAYSAMDVDRFRQAEPPEDAQEILGLRPGQPRPSVALMLAAFEPRKRHAQAIAELPAAFANSRPWRVVFAGEGPELEPCRRLVEQMGLQDNVRFTGYRRDPERLIALADVCFLTSEREGLPRVVVQYAAAGKPIVLNDLPGLSDVIGEPGAAVIAPAADVAATMRSVAGLLEDKGARAALATAVRRIDVDRWSPASMARAIEAAYLAGRSRAVQRTSVAARKLPETAFAECKARVAEGGVGDAGR
jgi:glycosyltransferase involved in cell wall biosynthesis